MRASLPLLFAVSLLLVACGTRMTPHQRGRRIVEERFVAAAPVLGQLAPGVSLFDADGKEHQLRELLEGNYTVLVFGCLT